MGDTVLLDVKTFVHIIDKISSFYINFTFSASSKTVHL